MAETRNKTTPSLEGLWTRRAVPADAQVMAQIYNEGIDDRIATFETRHRTREEVLAWACFSDPQKRFPVIVLVEGGKEERKTARSNTNESEPTSNTITADTKGRVLAYASTAAYSPRACYAGIADFSVYVARSARGRGIGQQGIVAMQLDTHADTGFTMSGVEDVGGEFG